MDIPTHLLPTRMDRADYARNVHLHRVPAGIPVETVLNPNYWAHLTAKMRVGDVVEIVAADYSYDFDARVVAIDPRGHWAELMPRSGVRHSAMAAKPKRGPAPDPHGYVIENDPVQGWRILNGRDLIAKDFATEDEAKAALASLKAATCPAPKKAA